MDITKLPIGGLVIGGLGAAIALTFVIAFAMTDTDSGTSGAVVATEAPPPGVAAVINAIPTLKFDTNRVVVPAAQPAVVRFRNRDGSTLHNFAVYPSKQQASASSLIAGTSVCASCTEDVTLTLQRGEYYFRCDVHPQMEGAVVAQ